MCDVVVVCVGVGSCVVVPVDCVVVGVCVVVVVFVVAYFLLFCCLS